jgi:hypothetical protein
VKGLRGDGRVLLRGRGKKENVDIYPRLKLKVHEDTQPTTYELHRYQSKFHFNDSLITGRFRLLKSLTVSE